MTTAIIERDVIVPAASEAGRTPFSWSAAIAGALAAAAVTFIIVALGSGIGLSFASPYGSGPSATSLTIAAAVWLVMAQTMGFATGGYLAGRLRSPAYDGVIGETTFRDAAQGLVVWAIGVVAVTTLAGALGFFAAGATAHVAAGTAAGMGAAPRSEPASTASASAPTEYFVDLLFRPAPGTGTAGGQRPASDTVGVAPAGAQPALSSEARAEVNRIPAPGFHRMRPSAASARSNPRRARTPRKPRTRSPRRVPICRSGLPCRSCSAAWQRRSPAFSAGRCATPKAARRNEHEMRGASCSI